MIGKRTLARCLDRNGVEHDLRSRVIDGFWCSRHGHRWLIIVNRLGIWRMKAAHFRKAPRK